MSNDTQDPNAADPILDDRPGSPDFFGATAHAMHHRRNEKAAFRRFWGSILHLGPVAITVTAACADPARLAEGRASFERWKAQKSQGQGPPPMDIELRHRQMMEKLTQRCPR